MTTTTRRKQAEEPSLESQLDRVAPGAWRQGQACLVVSTGEAAGAVFPLVHPAVLIGRSAEAKVRIDEHAISNDHALLEMDGSTFTLRDLGSTNGTYVNGQRIAQKVVLAGGDTIQMGSTTFLFLTRESQYPQGTVKLHGGAELVIPTRRSNRPARSVPVPERADEFTTSMSLTDMVTTVRRFWVYARRYGWIALLCAAIGGGAGAAHAVLRPPPGSAWFEMKLSAGARGDQDNTDLFAGAENTFRSLPLIRKTFADLGVPVVSDARASYTQSVLLFKRMGFNSSVYRGEFEDVTAERAAAFLNQQIQNYINSELDKVLQVLRVDAELDKKQEEDAGVRVAEVRGRLVEFSDRHPEAVPKDRTLPEAPVERPVAKGDPERLEQSIAANERALRAAYTRIQTQKAASYVEQSRAVEAKIAEARSHGLKDQHPELKSLLQLQSTLREKTNALLASEPSAGEQAIDPEVVRLQEQLAAQRRRLGSGAGSAAPRSASSAARRTAAAGSTKKGTAPQSLSQLRIEYAELAGEYERAKTEHGRLLEKRAQTDRQLERERTSARARYDVITPPTPAKKAPAAVIGKRAGLGAVVGLLCAVMIATYRELRRVLISRGHIQT